MYEPEFELHSPGQLLTEECVQAIFHEGAATYDLLAPDAAYKRDWASGVTKVGDYAIACSRRGRLWIALYLKGMRQGVKSTLALLPVGVRRRLLSVRANAQAILGG